MIQVIGIVRFLSSSSKEHFIIKSKNAFIEPFDIETTSRRNADGSHEYRISCKYVILLEEDSQCKSSSDYVGKVSSLLNKLLGNVWITTTQHYIKKVDIPVNHIADYFDNVLDHLN